MEQNEPTAGVETQTAEQKTDFDSAKAQLLMGRILEQQNLPLGLVGGLIAAIVGAVIWGAITVLTKFQIGWMAVGVGFLVGYTVRILGKGVSSSFGVVGAVCALLGCVLGNLLSTCGFVSIQNSIPFFQVVHIVLERPGAISDLMIASFSPMDILFYGIAVYEGYRFAFRQITQEELDTIGGPQ
jgi:uncharacterized membrane protein YsdA (DUF1294 family)